MTELGRIGRSDNTKLMLAGSAHRLLEEVKCLHSEGSTTCTYQ